MTKLKKWEKEIILSFLLDENINFPHEYTVKLKLYCHNEPNFGATKEHKGCNIDILSDRDWETKN